MSRDDTAATRDGFTRRLIALTRKEVRQLLRDRSNLLMGVGLPILLILLFGYGLSLDVNDARIAVADLDGTPLAHEVGMAIDGSPFMQVLWVRSQAEATALLDAHEVDAIVTMPNNFARQLAAGHAPLQLLLLGSDPTRAAAIQSYVQGAVGIWAQKRADRAGATADAAGTGVVVVNRMWFNAANTSTWYLVPGLVVLIMTLVGSFLTALVMAREWERGTLEALFVTPVRPVEVLLAKVIPYFAVGLVGLALCLIAAKLLFRVPIHGSLLLLVIAAMLYMFVALGQGLLISSVTRNQFLASQIALLSSFMPAMMLSGFIFDLRNTPAVVNTIGHLLPATYFMELMKTLFLAGNQWGLILRDCLILAGYAVLLLGLARVVTRKRLD